MNGKNENQAENQTDNPEVDDWTAAFEALAGQDEKDVQEPVSQGDGAEGSDDGQAVGDKSENGDKGLDVEGDGGLAPEPDVAGIIADNEEGRSSGVSQADIDEAIKSTKEDARNQAINEIAEMFVKEGVRNKNGKLGASIDDPDICRRDRDGVPTFYNPETGRPFTGDNPRRQAMEWVKDYNEELANKFNELCAKREKEIMKSAEPRIQTLRFQSTYEKLDPIRQGMLDDIISDYEVKDSDGDVIGYSCDLNRALDVVNRQIARIQGYAKSQPKPPTGPAMDMKTSSGANTGVDMSKITSLAEAMEFQQNQLLEKQKNKRRK